MPLEAILFAFLITAALTVMYLEDLFAAAMVTGVFSLLSAGLFTLMDAVDVAMTEASVGAGISTVLALGALYLTKTEEAAPRYSFMLPLFVAAGTGAMLIYGTWGLPGFGLADTPMNTGVGLDYLNRNYDETHIPNVVTSVLASYRGYDTLGETTVIFTAGIGVLLLLKRFQRAKEG